MKKPWFREKRYGYGWGLPVSWQGWVVLICYCAFLFSIFRHVDNQSHSASDTLLTVFPYLILSSVVLVIVAWKTSGKPKWRWGNNKSNKDKIQ